MPSAQFLNLPSRTQERIAHAALGEFAERGFDSASTNRIVECAGISKGVLFKYFRDKKALFLYVAERALDAYLTSLPDGAGGDVFDWLREATAWKLRFVHAQPVVYRLALRMVKEPHHPVYATALATQIEAQAGVAGRLRALVPVERLRRGVTPDDVVQLVTWVASGLADRFVPLAPEGVGEDFDTVYASLVAEFDRLVALLRTGLFREDVQA